MEDGLWVTEKAANNDIKEICKAEKEIAKANKKILPKANAMKIKLALSALPISLKLKHFYQQVYQFII